MGLRGPYRMYTRGMLPNEAQAWFREEAKRDYESRAIRDGADPYMSNRSACRISIRAIDERTGPPRRRPEIWRGETVLPQWYRQGSLSGGRGA